MKMSSGQGVDVDIDKLRLQFEVAIKDELLRFERTRVELLECKLEKASLEHEISRLRERVKQLERGGGVESTPVGESRRMSFEDDGEGRKRSSLEAGTQTVVAAAKKRVKGDSAWTRDSPRMDTHVSSDDEDVEGEKMEGEECVLTNHAIIKLQKTSQAKMRPDGTVYFEPIAGLKFCHRCKRTSAEVAFSESRTSVCDPCDARIKELAAHKTPSEKLKGQSKSSTNDDPDEKPKMTEIHRRKLWNKMLGAIEAGDVQKCEEVRKECVRLAEKYTHAHSWDREIFVMCAWRSKSPIDVTNWALLNNASHERNCAEIDALRTAVERVPEAFNTKEDGTYISAREVLEHFVRCGFNVTCDILHTACAFGSLECIKYLKKAVSCCDFERWKDFKRPNGEINQIMHVAAQEGHVEVLKYLYDNDCDFSVEDAEQCLDLAENRKPKRAKNSELVIEWIKQTNEWRESQVRDLTEPEVQ